MVTIKDFQFKRFICAECGAQVSVTFHADGEHEVGRCGCPEKERRPKQEREEPKDA